MSLSDALQWLIGAAVVIGALLAAMDAWRGRRTVVWDVQRQRWRAAGRVVADRSRHHR